VIAGIEAARSTLRIDVIAGAICDGRDLASSFEVVGELLDTVEAVIDTARRARSDVVRDVKHGFRDFYLTTGY
jgi:hypothetical protein